MSTTAIISACVCAIIALYAVWRRVTRRKLFIACFDLFFTTKPVGKVAEKCLKLAWRCLFLMRPGDAIIVARPVPEEFLKYFESVMGFMPIIYQIEDITTEPLDFVGAIIDNEELCARIRTDARKRNWVVAPLISHIRIFELANKLKMKVEGTSRRRVEKGLVRTRNRKIVFAQLMKNWGFEVAGKPQYLVDQIAKTAEQLIKRGAKVVVREDISAGGLGNGCFDELRELLTELEIHRAAHGEEFHAMVGPLLTHIEYHFSVVGRVGLLGPRIVITCKRRIKDHTESIGGVSPSLNLPGMARARRATWWYGWLLWITGYRGTYDIDFGSDDAGTLVVFESNARYLLTSAPIMIGRRFEDLWDLIHGSATVDYDEDPPRHKEHHISLEELVALAAKAEMRAQSKITSAEKVRVIIVSPPDPETGWFSFAAVGTSRHSAKQARKAFRTLLDTWVVGARGTPTDAARRALQ